MILILNRGKNCSFGDLQGKIKKECKNEVLIFALFRSKHVMLKSESFYAMMRLRKLIVLGGEMIV